jgi:hypothetical protein
MKTITFTGHRIGSAIANALNSGYTKPLRIERTNGRWLVTVAA